MDQMERGKDRGNRTEGNCDQESEKPRDRWWDAQRKRQRQTESRRMATRCVSRLVSFAGCVRHQMDQYGVQTSLCVCVCMHVHMPLMRLAACLLAYVQRCECMCVFAATLQAVTVQQ